MLVRLTRVAATDDRTESTKGKLERLQQLREEATKYLMKVVGPGDAPAVTRLASSDKVGARVAGLREIIADNLSKAGWRSQHLGRRELVYNRRDRGRSYHFLAG